MFSKYFEKINQEILKKTKPAKKGAAAQKDKKKTKDEAPAVDIIQLKDMLSKIIPSKFNIDAVRMIDPSGFSPEEVDLIAYREQYRDIQSIMGGYIPCELVYGTYHVTDTLNKDTLNDILRKVVQAKKINRYTEREDKPLMIPSFVVAYNSGIKLPDIKQMIIDNYMAMGIDNASEVDIIAVLDQGIIIKDWRNKRSYIALETGKDTLMWFFILMDEYLDVEKENEFDPRNYIKHGEKYNEY